MKIGILTFHKAYNYGAVLQCYALQEVLKQRGHEVLIVDYRPKLFDQYKLSTFFKRKNVIAILIGLFTLKFLRIYIKNKRYENFISTKLNVSCQVFKPDDIEKLGFDTVVIGSDQVWNTRVTRGYDPFYWGYFRCPSIVSYAASMETNEIKKEDRTSIAAGLKNFSLISVREEQLVNLLSPLYTGNIYKALDPTLQADSKAFDDLTLSEYPQKDSYLLIYQVIEDEKTRYIAETIAKQLGVEIIELKSKIGYFKRKGIIDTASPEYFLTLIKNAKCIVTTSFHGAAFSIIFKKDFYSVKLQNRGTRIENLLKNINMEDRLITEFEGEFQKIDYKKIESSYNLMKKETGDFLSLCNL